MCYNICISENMGENMTGESKKPRAAIVTLGCRVNQYESEAIAGLLEADGFEIVPFGTCADVTVVNTCTVTAESDRKSRQHIRRAVSASPDGKVIVTGCFAQISPEEAKAINGVSAVVGNADKSYLPALVRDLYEGRAPESAVIVSDLKNAPYDTLTLPVPRRARAFIKIEDGCENRCAYCIIPAARGKVRSKEPCVVIREAETLARAGCSEITLTGIETAAYGQDSGGRFSLATLLSDLAHVPGIRRIGLGSLDPSLMRDSFLETASTVPALLPHFHISLQSGSSSVLRRMRRPYNAGQAMERIDALRRVFPHAMLTADVIVGFPGESDSEFEETLDFCQKMNFMHLHIFPYSVRKGTEAADMPDQVPEPVKKERAARLAEVQRQIKSELLANYVEKHKSAPVSLLIEEFKGGYALGHSEHFVEIRIPAGNHRVGDTVEAYLTETDGEVCTGTARI